MPGSGYGIHVSACVHAISDAASSAGHTFGTSAPLGQSARTRVASHSNPIATVPKSIGQPASAASVTGRVNMRAGNIDCRAARSPPRP